MSAYFALLLQCSIQARPLIPLSKTNPNKTSAFSQLQIKKIFISFVGDGESHLQAIPSATKHNHLA